MAGDTTDLQGLPPWLKAAVYLGVPSVIALFLVYTLTAQVQQAVSEIRQAQALQAQTLSALQAAIATRVQDVNHDRQAFNEVADRLERLIRRSCMVAATTAEERATCLNGDK